MKKNNDFPSNGNLRYFIHLDTVRCYAVFMVVFAHIFQIWTWKDATESLFPLGQTGVVLFFVLSGFLITYILLKEPQHKPIAQSFKQFYIRRSLRIFPIYYLFLAICYIANISNVNDYGFALWFYLGNYYIFNHNSWIGEYSHLWTLAVEEQFYLLWPFLVLFLRTRTKALLILFVSVIALASLARFYLLSNGFSYTQAKVFPLANVDFFALGALIALGNIYCQQTVRSSGYPLVVTGLILYYGSYYVFEKMIFYMIGQLSIGLVATGVIIVALFSQAKEGILHNRMTVHIGKISYGIYLYHNTIVAHYAEIAGYFGIDAGNSYYMKIVISVLFTLIIAELSFWCIEKPCLRIKELFRSP